MATAKAPTAEPTTATKVVLIQDADNVIRSVSVNGTTVPVINAGPVVISGGMGVAMTLVGDISVQKADAAS